MPLKEDRELFWGQILNSTEQDMGWPALGDRKGFMSIYEIWTMRGKEMMERRKKLCTFLLVLTHINFASADRTSPSPNRGENLLGDHEGRRTAPSYMLIWRYTEMWYTLLCYSLCKPRCWTVISRNKCNDAHYAVYFLHQNSIFVTYTFSFFHC